MVQHDRWGGGSVTVWWAITITQKSALVHVDGNLNSKWYIHETLQMITIPFGLQAIGQGFILQADNAKPFAVHIVQDYNNSNPVYTEIEQPAYSPDFDPIEQAWDMLGQA